MTLACRWRDRPRKKVSNIVYSARWYLPGTCGVHADAMRVWSMAAMVNTTGVIDNARVRRKKGLRYPWTHGGGGRWW